MSAQQHRALSPALQRQIVAVCKLYVQRATETKQILEKINTLMFLTTYKKNTLKHSGKIKEGQNTKVRRDATSSG